MRRCINRITMEPFYFALFFMEISCPDTPARCCLATDMASQRQGKAVDREESICLEMEHLNLGLFLWWLCQAVAAGSSLETAALPNIKGELTSYC